MHRAWIADAYRELGRDEDALSLLLAASRDLQQQAVSDQPAFAGRVASAFETLAGKLTVLGDRAGEIEALERAHELCLQCADRVWLATIRNRLANATFAIGDTEASRRWLEQVRGQLPELEGDLDAAVVQVNLGLRYLDLGDHEASRDALERALAEYELTRGEDAPDVSYFLVPLIRVYAWLEDVQLASRLAERALACNLLDEHEWDSDFLDALLELARDVAGEDEHFDHLVELARTLSERRLDAAGRAEVLAQLAFFRSRFEWDDRAIELVDAAEQELDLAEGPPALLRAELAVLRAEALVSHDDSPEAAVGMLESAAASLRDGEPEALGRVLDSLAALQVSMGADAAAAASFEELKTILDGLQRSLPDRVQVRILLAEAQLRAGKRSAGVAELRQAAYLAEAADPPVDVEAVEALCRLARALVDDADDRARALDVLELAEALNDRLYALDEPQTDALPALASTVHDIRGVEAALAIVQAALRRVPNGFGAFVALHALVVEAGLTAESTLDLVTGSDDPDAIVTTSFILRDAFAFNRRHDDARAVLERALERLRATPAVTSPLELELLLALSELDESEDRGEARASLEAAIALAREHPDLLDRVSELEAHLGLVYADARMWDRAVAVLAAVEPGDEQRAAVEECLAIGRVITGDYERAIDDLNRLVADRAEPQLLYLLATAENATGRHQAALDSIAYAFSLGEPRPELLLLAARVCNDIAEYEAAIRYARAALELEPDDASAYSSIAWALQHLGPTRGEECEAAFQRVLDLTTDRESRIYALKGRAGARRALGREADARADYEEALAQLDPAADPWLEGWMRYNLGEFDAAKGAFERAVADSEDRISALFDLALCEAVAGAPDGSKAYRAALAKLREREPRRQLAPLRVARNDLRDAEFVHQRLRADETFQSIVTEVDAALERTEALVVRPILPEVPAPVFDGEG